MAPVHISPLSRDLPAIDGTGSPSSPGAPGSATGGSFASALGRAMASVETLQADADASAQQVALGSGNLHETALALEKADVALRVAVKVRNKLVEAYQDIMRMSV